jgi:cell division septum initiation protein DivIVA
MTNVHKIVPESAHDNMFGHSRSSCDPELIEKVDAAYAEWTGKLEEAENLKSEISKLKSALGSKTNRETELNKNLKVSESFVERLKKNVDELVHQLSMQESRAIKAENNVRSMEKLLREARVAIKFLSRMVNK